MLVTNKLLFCALFYDAVKSYRPVELTFHEPVSREIRDSLAGTSQRTAVVPAKAPGAARISLRASAETRARTVAGYRLCPAIIHRNVTGKAETQNSHDLDLNPYTLYTAPGRF